MDNPYESPQTPCLDEVNDGVPATAINRAVLILLVWLTPAAIAHAFWFDGWILGGFRSGISWESLRSVGGEVFMQVAAGLIAARFATPPLLMTASACIRRILAPQSPISDWHRVLAESMPSAAQKAPWLLVGWLIGTTEMAANGFAVVGPLICHLLAASWYLPLLVGWWRLRNTPLQQA